ncbi:MAG: metallophosphoesterase [Candidatus Promineifilaceae bacterium]
MIEETFIHSEPRDRLARGRLHKVMSALNKPAYWPAWQAVLLALFLCLAGGVIWYFPQQSWQTAVTAAAVLGLFFLGDIVILSLLPLRRISFCSWKAQFLALALPRTAAAAAVGFLAIWLPMNWAWVLLIAVQLAAAGLLFYGAHVEPARLRLTKLDIFSEHLPLGAEPIRLLHISDLHIERLSRREDDVLAYLDQTQPDLILITGDYLNLSFNRDPEAYRQAGEFLSQLASPQGVYAVLGTPTVDLCEAIAPLFVDLPLTLLRDEWYEVCWSDGRRLTLLGLDCTHDIDLDARRLQTLVKSAPPSAPKLLLYHSPELMPGAAELDIDLFLCGHTHGGQVRLPVIGPLLTSSHLGRKYVMGHYRSGKTDLYVSTGVGLEGLSAPRVRFLAPPEITLVTIRPSAL